MMTILNTISRILVGSLFIVSGLIKANDTLGFSYKLVEYFEPGVLNMEFLIPFALPLSIIICIVEVVLGCLTLMGAYMKLNSWLLMGMIVFFTFLTFYSAYFNKVTDCGCFGDAIKLTPWESFTKDVVLLFFITIIFINKAKTKVNTMVQDRVLIPIALIIITLFAEGMLGWSFPWIFSFFLFLVILLIKYGLRISWSLPLQTGITLLFTAVFTHLTYSHLPMKDFRPYAIGKSIPEGMKSAEELGLESPIYAVNYMLKNKKSGEEKIFPSTEYTDKQLYNDWDFVESIGESYKVKDGYESPIHDFSIVSDYDGDITYSVLESEKPILLVIAYDIEKSCKRAQTGINELANAMQNEGMEVVGLTASGEEFVQEFKHSTQSMVDYYNADAIVLKTVVRSNPGLVLIEKGVIKGKWHHHNTPSLAKIKDALSK